ncbi:hypothetical protein ADS77_18050 [Pseudoalteromonas porphyrae]|uniref:Uncharacterized protein n=1 Tax=Pseudoalteromonas porphyrae TaxID=187330 RepID=A0A0N1EER5_9GAMM|nr:hypothetical protein ADS77_18050 [Pseudoalteromonas porphyrae]
MRALYIHKHTNQLDYIFNFLFNMVLTTLNAWSSFVQQNSSSFLLITACAIRYLMIEFSPHLKEDNYLGPSYESYFI